MFRLLLSLHPSSGGLCLADAAGPIVLGVACVALASAQPPPSTQPAAPAPPPAHDETAWFRNVRQLTSTEMGLARSGEAYFSPDVKRICFQAKPIGQDEYQIYVMNLDGTGLEMVSTGRGATTCSYFHPSGQKLIFAANHHDLRPAVAPEHLEPMRPRGGGAGGGPPGAGGGPPTTSPATAATTAGGGSPAEGGTPPGERGAAESDPGSPPSSPGHPGGATRPAAQPGAGSPHADGPRHGGGDGYAWQYFPGMDIYEYTFATRSLRRLTYADGYDAECAYSPDGEWIVFSSMRDGDQEIYICDADGGRPRRITHAPGRDGGPFFSPDGRRVVYRSDRAGNGNLQIFVNNVDGTAEKALTDDQTFNWSPYWHPSGKWIVFTHADFRGRPNFDLYIIRDDGSERHRVTSDPAFDGLPVFSPDGRYLMWTSSRGGLASPQVFIAEFVGLTPDGTLRAGR